MTSHGEGSRMCPYIRSLDAVIISSDRLIPSMMLYFPLQVWEYIKKNKLNEGRTIKPDQKLKAVFPVASPLASSERMSC